MNSLPNRPPLRDAFMLSLVDRDGVITYQSSAIRMLLGYDYDQVAGRPWFSLLRGEDSRHVGRQFASLVEEGSERARWVVRFRSAVGDWCPVDVRARNLLADPEVGSVLLSMRAIPGMPTRA